MKNQLFDYLNFGKSERVAIITVILLIIFILLLPLLYSHFHKPKQVIDAEFDKEIAEFLKNEEAFAKTDQKGFDFTNPEKEIVRRSITPFRFDPNSLDKNGWMKLGFSEKQATGIMKYIEKGGRFRKKEDLKKLYAISGETYNLLEPYIEIADQDPQRKHPDKDENRPASATGFAVKKYQVELNSADSAELVKVYGIGPATARRILRYREKLGGFASPEQLKEVSGIDSTRYEMIKDGVFADAEVIIKIDVNNATIVQLRQHPYIDYYVAKSIVDRRISRGEFTSPDELSEIPLIYETLFKKLRPYISTN
ncbi:MAG: ComEA family DNA-binding protein [Lentimicrobium sp.]